MKPLGLRSKLTLLYTAIFTALSVGLFVGAYYLLSQDLDSTASGQVVELAAALRGYFHFEDGKPVLNYDVNDSEVAYFINTATRYSQIYDLTNGELITQSQELRLLGLSFSPEEVRDIEQGPQMMDIGTDEGRIRFFNDRLAADSGRVFLLQVGANLEPADNTLSRFRELSLLLLPLGIVFGATAGFLMAGRVLSPIRTIARTAQEIEVAQLNRRLPVSGSGDDLDRLAATFNDMLVRLEKAVGEMKQFTASIAHELRTPLTALRGEAELALLQHRPPEEYRAVLSSQLEEFEKLTRTINQLLTLARAESGELRLVRESFDAAEMLKNFVETFSLIAAEKEISLALEVEGAMLIDGDPQWIERAMVNLLDNAVKYTQRGGSVVVRVWQDAGESRIQIRDTGVGIPESAIPYIFERFYRADASRGKTIEGVGLGLSLVHWIVTQHSGSIDVESHVASGTTFTIRIPSPAPTLNTFNLRFTLI